MQIGEAKEQKPVEEIVVKPVYDKDSWELLLVNGTHAISNEYEVVLAAVEEGHRVDQRIEPALRKMLEAMRADSGIELASLKVDGGASANDFLMQTQADIINAPVNRPVCVETTAMGAAYLAGLAVGYWSGKEDVIKNWAIDATFEPVISEDERKKRVKGWNRAVKYAYGWAKEE